MKLLKNCLIPGILLIVIAVSSMFVGGQAIPPFGSDVVAITTNDVIAGLQACMKSAPGTFIMTNGETLYMFAWRVDQTKMAFVVIDGATRNPVLNWAAKSGLGQGVGFHSFAELRSFLSESANWYDLAPRSVLVELAADIMSVDGFLALGTRAWPTMMFFFATPIPDEFLIVKG